MTSQIQSTQQDHATKQVPLVQASSSHPSPPSPPFPSSKTQSGNSTSHIAPANSSLTPDPQYVSKEELISVEPNPTASCVIYSTEPTDESQFTHEPDLMISLSESAQAELLLTRAAYIERSHINHDNAKTMAHAIMQEHPGWNGLHRDCRDYVKNRAVCAVKPDKYLAVSSNKHTIDEKAPPDPHPVGTYVRIRGLRKSNLHRYWSHVYAIVSYNQYGYKLRCMGRSNAKVLPKRYPHRLLAKSSSIEADNKLNDESRTVLYVNGFFTEKNHAPITRKLTIKCFYRIRAMGSNADEWVQHLEPSIKDAFKALRKTSKEFELCYKVPIELSDYPLTGGRAYVDSDHDEDPNDDPDLLMDVNASVM